MSAGAMIPPEVARFLEEQPEGAAAVWVPARELVTWEGNYVEHPASQLALIRASIARNGWGEPVVAQAGSNLVISGNGRLSAYLALLEGGELFEELAELEPADQAHLAAGRIPVRFRVLPDARARELAIASNEAARAAVRNPDRLAGLVRTLAEDIAREDAKVAELALGLSEREVTSLLKRSGFLVDPRTLEPPPIPPIPESPDSERGGIYELGPHRLACGDSLVDEHVDALLAGVLPDVHFCDPPYAIYGSASGISSSIADDKLVRPFFRGVLVQIARTSRLFGPAYVCCDWRSWATWWDVCRGLPLEVKNKLIWDKGGSGLGNNYANTYEEIGYFLHLPEQKAMTSARKAGIRPVLRSNVLRAKRPTGDDRHHNAAKPADLIAEILEQHEHDGSAKLVCDLFAGSGQTLFAAARQGWTAYLSEIEPGWCDVIRRRWTAFADAAGMDAGPGALR